MKIRTDFVTNSSSSGFVLEIRVFDKSGKEYLLQTPDYSGFDWKFEGGVDCKPDFTGDLASVPERIKSVAELCKFLTDSIDPYLDKYDEDYEEVSMYYRSRQEAFCSKVAENIENLSDISRVEIKRDYYAWGEFVSRLPDGDEKLCKLAEAVRNSAGEERKAAEKQMLDYMRTPNKKRATREFGKGYDDIRYIGGSVDKMVDYLCNHSYEGSLEEGAEYKTLDMQTGEYSKYAEFDLDSFQW